MTESEAKTKWCPMVHKRTVVIISVDEPNQERTNSVLDRADKCIGPACMMWREHGPFSPDYDPRPDEVGGFCGLAGRP